jgi:hypothetical protein
LEISPSTTVVVFVDIFEFNVLILDSIDNNEFAMIPSTYPRFTASLKSVASATFLICSPNTSKLSEDTMYIVELSTESFATRFEYSELSI